MHEADNRCGEGVLGPHGLRPFVHARWFTRPKPTVVRSLAMLRTRGWITTAKRGDAIGRTNIVSRSDGWPMIIKAD